MFWYIYVLMAKRNKLEKFAELASFPNVLEFSENGFQIGKAFNGFEDILIKGNWNKLYFKDQNPIVLELACGRGEYSCVLAEKYPERNFIGVDIKGARIWKGAKYALENKLENVAFLRIRIEYIGYFFSESEVDEIWMTFPDPFLKEKKSNRRLTSPQFLKRYQNILRESGIIHLKTDDKMLYQFTLETIRQLEGTQLIEAIDNIYAQNQLSEDLKIKTYYEARHLEDNRTIKYVKFSLA